MESRLEQLESLVAILTSNLEDMEVRGGPSRPDATVPAGNAFARQKTRTKILGTGIFRQHAGDSKSGGKQRNLTLVAKSGLNKTFELGAIKESLAEGDLNQNDGSMSGSSDGETTTV